MVSHEVTAAEIARIAGVGRAAVSNWRRRHPDFPAPVGGPPNSPTFALADVEAWLTANDRTADVSLSVTPRVAGPLDDAGLARAMAALIPPLSRGTVLDPACGSGGMLTAAAERLGARLRYVGLDVDSGQIDLARTAMSKVGAATVELDVGSPGGYEDAAPSPEADVVITMAPLSGRPIETSTWEYGQPNRNDQPLGWVQVCVSYLRPGGTVVVAVPFAMAVRASGRRIRAELLRAGALTHVIALSEKINAATPGGPRQIWLLTRPVGRPTYVLRLVDLTDSSPDALPKDGRAWTAVFADPARTRDVPAIELLDEDVFLVPAAHTAHHGRDVTPEYAALRDRYRAAVRRLADTAPVFGAADPEATSELFTIGELARSGALSYVDRDDARPGDVIIPANPGGFEASVFDGVHDRSTRTASVLRCAPDLLDPHFVACFLRSETNRRQAAGTMGGTYRLDVRRARVPRLPLSQQRRYGEAFRRLMEFVDAADEVAGAATAAARTAIYGLTGGSIAPEEKRK